MASDPTPASSGADPGGQPGGRVEPAALARRDAILEAVRFATERFLRNLASWDENIGDLLATFGRALGVSRVYIFENEIDDDGVLRCYQRHEWAAPGVSPLIDPALSTPMQFGDSGWRRWKDLLQRGVPVVGKTRDFPADEQVILRRERTRSLVVAPIFVDDAWWGFIGFDDCVQERDWSAVELDALKAAASTLGAAIGRQRADAVSARRDAVLEAVRYAGERFLAPGPTWQERVEDVLRHLGRATGVSRTYVSMNELNADGELCNSVIHEWTTPGIEPWAGNPRYQAIPILRSGMQVWMEKLERGEMLFGHMRDFGAPGQPEEIATRSFVSVPIFVDGAWWGAIGFDECVREREFSAPERDALKAAADMLGAAIQRDRADAASSRLAAIVESTNDAIFGMLRDGTITSWNASAERLYGYDEGEMVGQRIHSLLHPAELDRLRQALVALTAHESVAPVEAEFRRKDGSPVWVSMTFSMIRDAAGEVTGTSAIARDVTDRKRAEAEVARRDAILDAVRFAAQRFLDPATPWEDSLPEVLARLGRATGVCQVYVARKWTDANGETWSRTVQEWKATGQPVPDPAATTPPITFRSLGLGHLVDAFGRGELVHGHARDFPDPARRYAQDQGVRSFVIVPIFVDGQWWGTIGFDECEREREFSASERDTLQAAAGTLGAAIGREQAEERNAWLAAIVEGSDDAIVGRTLDNTIVSWNPGAERLYGYRADEVVGKRVDVLLPDEEREAMDRIFADIRHGKSVAHVETSRPHKDGTRLMVSITSSPVRNKAGEVIGSASASRDISERLRAEAELRESQRSLSTLLSNLPGVAYRRHFAGDGWELDFVSQGSFALSGYHAEDLVGPNRVPPFSITHPDDRPRVLGEIDAALAQDEPFQVSYRMRTASGSEKWVLDQGRGVRDEAGQLLAIEGIITDITERVQSRQQLEQRVEERTRELATLLNVSASIASTLELVPLLGVILDQLRQVVPHIAAAIFSLEHDRELRLLDYRGPVAREDLAWTWPLEEAGHGHTVIETRLPVIIDDVRADTAHARAFRQKSIRDHGSVPAATASWMGVPLLFGEHVLGILAVDSDRAGAYTARDAELAAAFAAQAAIAIVNARLYERAQGTAALEERQRLARELHDSVSQALFGIGLGARTARTLLDTDPAAAAAPLDYVLSLAEAGLTEMRALIFELRPEALEQEGLVAALDKQVANLMARHGISVEASLGDPGEVSLAVEEAIYRIAQEALNNIVKHAGATRVGLRLVRTGDRLVLAIHDNGAGFDPTASFSGHLGLTTMRERAERLGGTLALASAPGEGTRLHAEVPV